VTVRVAVFSTKRYDRESLEAENGAGGHGHELVFLEARLGPETARLAQGFDAVCAFVNDVLDRPTLEALRAGGVRLVALRCAGFNNVDLAGADALDLAVVRVPAYSPHAVAEHTVALLLALNRKLHRAHARVREGNFSLDGLLGFDLNGKTAGVVGTGQIGRVVVKILRGLGMEVLAHDLQPDPRSLALGARYVPLDDLLRGSDVVTLHCPLTPATRHLVDARALGLLRPGATLVNTSRGALVDTPAVIEALKTGHLGNLALDVYEEEADLFFEDLSGHAIQDDVFARLLTFPNVLITGHQAFFTREALTKIAATTLENVSEFARDGRAPNRVTASRVRHG